MAKGAAAGYQVLIPYSELERLLSCAQKVDDLNLTIGRLQEQQAALRGQFLDVMEAFSELKRYVTD